MKRVITALVGILILIPVCIYSHTLVWPLVMTLLTEIATFEILRCTGVYNKPLFAIPFYGFALLPTAVWIFSDLHIAMTRVIVSAVFLLFLCEFMSIIFTRNTLSGDKVYSSIALVIYVVLAFTALIMSRRFTYGGYIFILVFLGAWGSDTFAFLTGKLIGKHKLCPEISPKKTIEGAIGGIIGNALLFACYALLLNNVIKTEVHAGVWQFAVLGSVLSVMGQLGDMFASSVKRNYGIKDFGNVFPGHGGVLDRFDSNLGISCALFLVYNVFGSSFLMG